MVGDEAQLTQCDPNLAQGPNSSLNFAQNWKKELLIRVVQDRPRRTAHADSVAPRVSLIGSVLDFARGCSRKERKLVKKVSKTMSNLARTSFFQTPW